MIRHWRWLDEIRSSLPERGRADLIVTSGADVRYLHLDRESIDRSLASVRKATRIGAAVVGGLVVVIAGLAWSRYAAGRAYSELVADLERAAPPSAGKDGKPVDPVLAMKAGAERLRDALHLAAARDEAFRIYVAATRHLLERDNERAAQQIASLGLSRSSAGRGGKEPSGIGGSEAPSGETLNMLSEYLSDEVQKLLLANQDLHHFIGELPQHMPMSDARLTSSYGVRRHPITGRMDLHEGMDLVSDGDRTVHAASSGTVTQAGWRPGYGKTVVVRSDYGIESLYGHLARIDVRAGQQLQAGTAVGLMGNTGSSTGPHLHFEVRQGGRPVNPANILKGQGSVQDQAR